MPEVITNNLDLWTSALLTKSTAGRGSNGKLEAYGIKKLRELILELAVRGKLVPQDPRDEPAGVLLEKIAKKRDELVEEGELKKQSPILEDAVDEALFELPHGWEFARFGTAVFNRDAERVPLSVEERSGRRGRYDYYGASGVIDSIDDFLFDKPLLLIGEDGANLINRSTPIAFMARGKYWVNNHAHVLDGLTEDLLLYICLHINAINLEPYVTGTAQPKMNQAKMNSIVLALPPENEQKRIVAKVDELMALCDQLEQQQTHSLEAHQALVASLLGALTRVESQQEFSAAWARIASHFDTLFTTEASIDQLKQTILQLAVMGKLVPQDPNDEPARLLLERVSKIKVGLVGEGKLKDQKILTGKEQQTASSFLPGNWQLVCLGDLVSVMDAGWSPACQPEPSPNDEVWGVLKTTAVQVMQYLQEENKVLPHNKEPKPQYEVKAGDILITRAGPKNRVAISCLVEATRPRLMISDKIIRFHLVEVGIYKRYISLCLNAGVTAEYLEASKSGMAESQMNISQDKLRLAPIPLCPTNEQHRIVAKVDELMALCDALKVRLADAQAIQLHLADAIVEHAVA